MWPWEHLAFGYVFVSLVWRLAGWDVDGPVAVWIAVGTQFPDLVDKTLWLAFDVVPTPRTVAHSLLTIAPVSTVAVVAATRANRRGWGLAFALAYATHLATDALPRVLDGYYDGVTFLLWPVLSPPDSRETWLPRFLELLASPEVYFSTLSYRTGFLLVALAVWFADGLPTVVDLYRFLTPDPTGPDE
jgi:hypothetical protein